MLVTNIIDEDIINYKKISLFVGTCFCSGKCWKDLGLPADTCQNESLRTAKRFNISINDLIERFENNPLSEAVVFGGMEPLDSLDDLEAFVMNFRYRNANDIVIYTGYTEEEALQKEQFKHIILNENIIVKFGRFIPNKEKHFDENLGVYLASPNQYSKCYNKLNEMYC